METRADAHNQEAGEGMALRSWVNSANNAQTDFPLENLPYGVFEGEGGPRIVVAIGDRILDLHGCADDGLLADAGEEVEEACRAARLNALMALGADAWHALRGRLTALLHAERASKVERQHAQAKLIPMKNARMLLPVEIGDYTDFYASIHHATRVGKLFRPDSPLLPNYKYLPIGYHGRSSSIVLSGTEIHRPAGQTKSANGEITYGPSQALDFELEVGLFIGPGNAQGTTIGIDAAEEHIFGLCLVNDWSARDLQAWEYQPLGPFLAKSFATSISPWVVPLEALAPYRLSTDQRAAGDPELMTYLRSRTSHPQAFDVTLEARLSSRAMRASGMEPMRICHGNLRHLYWTLAQLVTHHASNGCNLRPGDLLATGTVSGPEDGSEGCLLEKRHRNEPVCLPNGEMRAFLEDGDEVVLTAYAHRDGMPRIGFGACAGRIGGAADAE